MDLELLREFQVFAVSQNLSKAAKVLHVTQSCLSKHIAEIERTTGLSLLDHGPKSVSLTPVGECFLREVSPIVSSYDNCLIQCRKLQQRYDNMLMAITSMGSSFSCAMSSRCCIQSAR